MLIESFYISGVEKGFLLCCLQGHTFADPVEFRPESNFDNVRPHHTNPYIVLKRFYRNATQFNSIYEAYDRLISIGEKQRQTMFQWFYQDPEKHDRISMEEWEKGFLLRWEKQNAH